MTQWTKQESDWLVKQCQSDASRWTIIKNYYKKFGELRSPDAIQRKITDFQQQGIVSPRKIYERNLVIGVGDIESTSLKGDTGFMISYYLKEIGKDKMYKSVIDTKEIFQRKFDSRLCSNFIRDIHNFDVLYFHF